MKKIAIIDLLFNWPPDGGARVDMMEVSSRLARYANVRMFVPDFGKFFPRGTIEGDFPFPVERLKFSKKDFNAASLAKRIKERIAGFCPDFVYIGDGYFLKPHVICALKEYRTVLRYYAYEPICILKSGKYSRKGRICNRNFLEKPLFCLVCALSSFGWRPGVFSYEFYKSRAFLPGYRGFVEENMRSANKIIVYNRIIKERISGYNNKIEIIPSGVDTSKFCPGKKERDINTILMTGRIRDPVKGFSVLKKAVEIIRQRGRDISLRVTGERKFKEGYITSTGWLRREEMPGTYQRAAICVVPSVWPEPFGIVAIEAMACGCPVIASDTGGLREIIDNGVDGILFRPGNADELSQKIENLLDDRNLGERIGKKGRDKACAIYDWDKIFENYYRKIFEL